MLRASKGDADAYLLQGPAWCMDIPCELYPSVGSWTFCIAWDITGGTHASPVCILTYCYSHSHLPHVAETPQAFVNVVDAVNAICRLREEALHSQPAIAVSMQHNE